MGIPTGGYPKMVTGGDANGRSVPLVYPTGDAKQYMFVIFNSAADEQAYTGNGVAITAVSPPTSTHGNGWSGGNWKK